MGNVLLKNKRLSADGQNIAQNYTTIRVVVTRHYWTTVRPHPTPRRKSVAIFRIVLASLKKGKSTGVNNIPAERVQADGETSIDV